MEVDHFDPRQKDHLIQQYDNLFLSTRFCNNKKRNNWPTKTEARAGARFLNPCQELDYDHQIFENPITHRLEGATPAAQWHIRTCGLNADHLVRERALRAKYHRQLTEAPMSIKQGKDPQVVLDVVDSLKAEVQKMIPPIAAR